MSLTKSFYKILDIIINQEQVFLSGRKESTPYKKVKRDDSEIIEWHLDIKI
ncbi:hypothetical protein [Clostridium baratii]|uniref:hypothetical protein n=1 Tax=Clostridium baratii TaxID=1561 RepID=UPI002943CA49|nr:hypothetical protein [Clostridium baratii]